VDDVDNGNRHMSFLLVACVCVRVSGTVVRHCFSLLYAALVENVIAVD
jgi:hypothetical protein